MRRHLVILVIVTLGIRGWLFVSYPIGDAIDNRPELDDTDPAREDPGWA
jgi:hypothetical protein